MPTEDKKIVSLKQGLFFNRWNAIAIAFNKTAPREQHLALLNVNGNCYGLSMTWSLYAEEEQEAMMNMVIREPKKILLALKNGSLPREIKNIINFVYTVKKFQDTQHTLPQFALKNFEKLGAKPENITSKVFEAHNIYALQKTIASIPLNGDAVVCLYHHAINIKNRAEKIIVYDCNTEQRKEFTSLKKAAQEVIRIANKLYASHLLFSSPFWRVDLKFKGLVLSCLSHVHFARPTVFKFVLRHPSVGIANANANANGIGKQAVTEASPLLPKPKNQHFDSANLQSQAFLLLLLHDTPALQALFKQYPKLVSDDSWSPYGMSFCVKGSAFNEAVWQKNISLVKLFLEHGAKASDKGLILHGAALEEGGEILDLLLNSNCGARKLVNQFNALGQTPIMNAIYYGHQECFVQLKQAGANFVCRDKNENTLLHFAAEGVIEKVEIINDILHSGIVNIHAKNKIGLTATMIAIKNQRPETLRLLVSYGAIIPNYKDWSPKVLAVLTSTEKRAIALFYRYHHAAPINQASAGANEETFLLERREGKRRAM